MLFLSVSSSSSPSTSSSMLLTSLQKVSMEMQQGSEASVEGFGGRVEEVGRQVMCEDDNILQEEIKHVHERS